MIIFVFIILLWAGADFIGNRARNKEEAIVYLVAFLVVPIVIVYSLLALTSY
jgi:4-amino-4-deoxy-L-arabinose transferase-like glycosyltransferase